MDFLDYVKMCQEDTQSVPETMPSMPETMSGGMAPMPEDRNFMPENMCRGMLYKVETGDTLYSISRRYDLRVRDLMQANPFVNVYNLQVGEELCLPVAPGNPSAGTRPYVVKKDDTLLSILNQNRVTFEELARLNRSVAVLKIPAGTVLLIP